MASHALSDHPSATIKSVEDIVPVVSLGDWLLLVLVVVASTVAATFIVPAWQSGVKDSMLGDRPRVFWYLGRSSALVGFLWLWLSMIFGLLMTNRVARAWPGGPSVMELHQFSGFAGLLFGVFHAFVLMGSRFLHYDVLDVIVPFHSDSYRTVWVGLGQLALHLIVVVSLSVYARRYITQRVWRLLHYLSFLAFALVIAHGVESGSDSESPLVLCLYIISALSVAALLLTRIGRGLSKARAKRQQQGPTAAPTEPLVTVQAPETRAPRAKVQKTASAAKAAECVHVIFGSQSGNAEDLARRTVKALAKHGVVTRAISGEQFAANMPQSAGRLIVITSTYGDGQAPDNMQALLEQLHSKPPAKLTRFSYCVLALGDSGYANFCQAGKDIDAQLCAAGAERALALVTCDVDYEKTFHSWLSSVMASLPTAESGPARAARSVKRATAAPKSAAPKTVRARRAPANASKTKMTVPQVDGLRQMTPAAIALRASVPDETKFFVMPSSTNERKYAGAKFFTAPVLRNINLTSDADPGNVRQIRQVVFSLLGSHLNYEPGDALGVLPENAADSVQDVLLATGLQENASVPLPEGGEASLRTALTLHYDITRLTSDHIHSVAERTGSAVLRHWLKPENADTLKAMTDGRQLIDLLSTNRGAFGDAREFVSTLRALKPRLYSISSSQKAFSQQVHLTVGVVRYTAHGRQRQGVCSGDLARATAQSTRQVFVHAQKAFRLPADPRTPIIMVGPGTGIAPFRAFLQERAHTGAPGKSWLFFGCCNARLDFLYQDELHQMQTSGVLTRLDVAFSRDQQHKVYVQHLVREKADKLWRWLDEGAHFYVCGDATKMAKDVDAALHEVAVRAGGLSEDAARDWVAQLKQQKRYQRDVY